MPLPEIPPDASGSLPSLREARDAAIDDLERRYLESLMTHTQGDIQQACQISGLSRSRLYVLLKKYDISNPGTPSTT